VADQSAALFGEGCFDKGDTKVTLGTGCFFNVVTGNTACTSGGGCYPLIAWNIGKELTFCMEGSEQNCGMWMDLLQRTGFVQQVQELEKIASEVDDSGSVYCVPALVGMNNLPSHPNEFHDDKQQFIVFAWALPQVLALLIGIQELEDYLLVSMHTLRVVISSEVLWNLSLFAFTVRDFVLPHFLSPKH
jgi:hypothetical protein